MAQKSNALDFIITAAVVSAIGFSWIGFALDVFKIVWRGISTSPEDLKPITKEIVMCEKCQEHFIDDGEELEFKKILCEFCRDYELKK